MREEDANDSEGGVKGGGNGKTGKAGGNNNSVLSQLAELFWSISKQKRRSGHLAPTEFLRTLRERNELFRGNMQQVSIPPSIYRKDFWASVEMPFVFFILFCISYSVPWVLSAFHQQSNRILGPSILLLGTWISYKHGGSPSVHP